MTVPLSNDKKGGVIHPGAHIVEFIEEGMRIHKDNLLPCWKLEVGKRYEVFLTTAMGFIRYRLKDIVKCTGQFHNTPWIEFCCKAQMLKLEYCSLTSQDIEKMLVDSQFTMQAHWYFARNKEGSRLALITDEEYHADKAIMTTMHHALEKISPTYAHGIKNNEVFEPIHIQVKKSKLLKGRHAQSKPKLINVQEVW